MQGSHPAALGLTFAVCQAIDENKGVQQVIDLFHQSGGRFIFQGGLEPYLNPERHLWESGVLSCNVRHPALSPDELTGHDAQRLGQAALALPRASFGYIPLSGIGPVPAADWRPIHAISLTQATGFADERKIDLVGLGLAQLAGILYPLFRPRFGYIDENVRGHPPLETYLRDEIPYLFWANIFGPEHAERLGREFLRSAPGWRLIEFPDGGVMHIASENYMNWWHTDKADLRNYFRQRLPEVEIYQSESI